MSSSTPLVAAIALATLVTATLARAQSATSQSPSLPPLGARSLESKVTPSAYEALIRKNLALPRSWQAFARTESPLEPTPGSSGFFREADMASAAGARARMRHPGFVQIIHDRKFRWTRATKSVPDPTD